MRAAPRTTSAGNDKVFLTMGALHELKAEKAKVMRVIFKSFCIDGTLTIDSELSNLTHPLSKLATLLGVGGTTQIQSTRSLEDTQSELRRDRHQVVKDISLNTFESHPCIISTKSVDLNGKPTVTR